MSGYKKRMEALEKRFNVLSFEKDGEVCFMGKGLIVTYDGFEKLHSQLLKTKGQLEKAEAVIKFYSDIKNWGEEYSSFIADDDLDQLSNWKGGKRAREYFEEKEGK